MRIGEICTRPVVHIRRESTLREAVSVMARQQVGALVVVEDGGGRGVPIGMLTDRDIAMAVLTAGADPDRASVTTAMTPEPVTCREDDGLFDVITLMRKRGIRRLPVVDANGALTGLVAADDLVGAIAEHLGELARALVGDELLETRRYGTQKTTLTRRR